MNRDPSSNNITSMNKYISHTPEETKPKAKIHRVIIDVTEFPNIEFTKRWSVKAPYIIKYDNVPLPECVRYIDPTIPIPEYITMLVKMEHRFRLPDGTELNYNGSDDYGLPKFITKDRRRTYRLSSTLEYKFMVLKKTIYALAFYLATPTSLRKIAEIFNASEHVLTEALRWLREPRKIVIKGEAHIVEWNDKRILVVYIDGARGGGKGIVTVGSKRYEIYISGYERDKETLKDTAKEIEKMAREMNIDMYLLVMDGAPWLAGFFIEYFDEKCIVVEHSHITWWEICIIYKYDGEWYTVRLRDDFFVEEKRTSPEIDIPPGYIEVWRGVVHAGYAGRAKREKKKVTSWRKLLNDVLEAKLFHEEMSEREFRTTLAWWIKRVNMLTWNLLRHGEDVREFVEKAKAAVIELCAEIKSVKNWEKLAKMLLRQLSMLINVYDEVKKAALSEFNAGEEALRRRDRKHVKKKRRRKKKRKIELIYNGPLSGAPSHAKDVIELLRKVFDGKHISNNEAEGRIGVFIHNVRSCRGNGKVLLKLMFQRQHVAFVFEYLTSHLRFGRGPRGDKIRFRVGKEYIIRYRDRRGRETERRIRVLSVGKRHITAFCYLRNEVRRFKKKRILSVVCCEVV